MTPERGVFIGQRKDRMGARLLMMLTCIRLAEDFDADYRVNWFPQGADAPELDQPQELFAQDWMDAHFLEPDAFEALTRDAKPIWSFLNDKTPDRLLAHLASGRSVLIEEGFEVLAFPWEDIEAIRPRYREFIHRIGFTEDIRAVMQRADDKLSGQGVSAYHIRRGDILNGLPWKHTTWPAKIEPEELYEAHLEKTRDRTAIMFSDQPELIAGFQERYPNLLQISDIADVSGMTRAKRDFLELYTMSRAEQVIAPIISAFSMAAARISGQQRKVFRDVLTQDELLQAGENVVQRLHRGAAGFLNPSEASHIYSKALFFLFRLNSEDRSDEACQIGEALLQAGADNAFMPLLQAMNLFYLQRWQEALALTRQALQNPHIWPEDYAVACALECAILGKLKKRWGAAQAFGRAFWAKPLRPDVVVLGSRVLYQDQLSLRALPPTDWALQRSIQRPLFEHSTHVAQRKVIGRRPCNFDMVLMDWSDLALDQKARRLFSDPARLEMLARGLERVSEIPPDDPRVRSFKALLQRHMGQTSNAASIDLMRKAAAQQPDNPIHHKRLADLYEADADWSRARLSMAEALACDPENPFLIFAMGRFLERAGDEEQGQNQVIQAADLDDTTAAIQGMAGQIQLRRGRKQEARAYLQKAHDLYPPFKRFANQLKRASD